MFLVSSCSYLYAICWSQLLSGEWRCSWSSADRRCSNYIWVITNSIAYPGAAYIREFTVLKIFFFHHISAFNYERHSSSKNSCIQTACFQSWQLESFALVADMRNTDVRNLYFLILTLEFVFKPLHLRLLWKFFFSMNFRKKKLKF